MPRPGPSLCPAIFAASTPQSPHLLRRWPCEASLSAPWRQSWIQMWPQILTPCNNHVRTPGDQSCVIKSDELTKGLYENLYVSATHLRFSWILMLSTSPKKVPINASSTSCFTSSTQLGTDCFLLIPKWPMRMPTVKKTTPHRAEINSTFNIVALSWEWDVQMRSPPSLGTWLADWLTDTELPSKDLWC